MQFLEEEILEITETTWSAMLGLDIQPNTTCAAPADGEDILIGQASISGGWNGQVRIHGTAALARSAASKIFAIDTGAVQAQDQIDAIYELTNIIAGNVKSLLPEPCQLSLPTVESGAEWEPSVTGADRVSEIAFQCEGQPLLVTVWKQRES